MNESMDQNQATEATAQPGRRRSGMKPIQKLFLGMALAILVLVVVCTFLIIKAMQAPAAPEVTVEQDLPAEVTSEEAEVLAGLGRLMILPDEVPSIATIVDVDTLIADQSFYVGAQNGDQLILYPQSQRAIIYSPSRNIIVNAGSLVVNDSIQ